MCVLVNIQICKQKCVYKKKYIYYYTQKRSDAEYTRHYVHKKFNVTDSGPISKNDVHKFFR